MNAFPKIFLVCGWVWLATVLPNRKLLQASALLPLSQSSLTSVGKAKIDYTAAAEYVEAHYRKIEYFGSHQNATISTRPIASRDQKGAYDVIRYETIFDARRGIVQKKVPEYQEQSIVIPSKLDDCGFMLLPAHSKVPNYADLNAVQSTYLSELRDQLIPKALQLENRKEEILSIAFWHPMLRGENLSTNPATACKPSTASVASMVHMDTDVGAYGLDGILHLVEKNCVESWMRVSPINSSDYCSNWDPTAIRELVLEKRCRFLLLNIWRPLVPVQSWPLGIWATQYNETEGYFPNSRPCLDSSRWYTFPNMQPSECLLFKQYDRRLDLPCDFWHCALDMMAPSCAQSSTGSTRVDVEIPRKSFDFKAMIVLQETVRADYDRLHAAVSPLLTLEQSGDFCNLQSTKRGFKHDDH